MKKSLGQRIIAGVLSLAMALTMFPTTVLAATSTVSRNYARMGSLKNDTLIASAMNGRVTYVGNYAYGENMYIMFALPQNASRVSLRIDGPVSGTLVGYNYRGHVKQSGTTANPVYKCIVLRIGEFTHNKNRARCRCLFCNALCFHALI